MTLIIKTTGWQDYLGEGAYIKALIMGAPGAGKTRSASFWPKPIVADCDQGRMSIADRGIPYGEIRSSSQMDELLDAVKREAARGADRKYHTLIIDTLDSYQRTVIHERLVSERKDALSGWADWGHLDAKMTQFVEKLLNLPMNIVVNLHTKETTEKITGDEESTLVTVGPKLKGDLREQIAAEFDLVGVMETDWAAVNGQRGLVRSIRWQPTPRYPILKDRSGRLPATTPVRFTDDDFSNLFQSIVGDHVEEFPETTVVEELGSTTSEVTPVGPDERGEVMATVADFPRTKKDKDTVEAVEPDPVLIEVDATSAPVEKAEEDKEIPHEGTTTGVVVEPEKVDEPVEPEKEEVSTEAKKADDRVCGGQPARMVGKSDPATGCGKSLSGEDKNRVDLAMLRTNTFLCSDCFETWKNEN
jgi:hypothetical protein